MVRNLWNSPDIPHILTECPGTSHNTTGIIMLSSSTSLFMYISCHIIYVFTFVERSCVVSQYVYVSMYVYMHVLISLFYNLIAAVCGRGYYEIIN